MVSCGISNARVIYGGLSKDRSGPVFARRRYFDQREEYSTQEIRGRIADSEVGLSNLKGADLAGDSGL